MCNRAIAPADYENREVVVVTDEPRPIKQWDVRWIDYGMEIGRHPGIIITNSGYNVAGVINTAMITSKVINDNMKKTIIGDLMVYIRLLPLNDGTTSRVKLDKFYPVSAGQIGNYIGSVANNEKLKSYIMACNIAIITGVVPVPYEQYAAPTGTAHGPNSPIQVAVPVTKNEPTPVVSNSVKPMVNARSVVEPKLSPMELAKDRKVARRTDPVEVRVAINCNRFFDGSQQLMCTAIWMFDVKQIGINDFVRMFNSSTETVTRMISDFKLAVKSGVWPQAKNEGSNYVSKLQTMKCEADNKSTASSKDNDIFRISLSLFKDNKFVKITGENSYYPYGKLKGYREFNEEALKSCFTEEEFVNLAQKYNFTLNSVWVQFKKGTIRFMVDQKNNIYVFKKDMVTMGKNGHYTDGRKIEIEI